MSMLLEAEKLGVQVTGRDGIDPSNHDNEHQIVFFNEAGKKICDQLVVVKRRSQRDDVIYILSHLEVIIER
jgi:hypothetical protein